MSAFETREQVLEAVNAGTISVQEAAEALSSLDMAKKKFGLKVTEKGGVAVTGLRRFPITCYPQEWEVILDNAEKIREFIGENKAQLSYR